MAEQTGNSVEAAVTAATKEHQVLRAAIVTTLLVAYTGIETAGTRVRSELQTLASVEHRLTEANAASSALSAKRREALDKLNEALNARDNAPAEARETRQREVDERQRGYDRYDAPLRDLERLRSQAKTEKDRINRTLGETQTLELGGFKVPVPILILSVAWCLLLLSLLRGAHAARRRVLDALVADPDGRVAPPIAAPAWVAPLPRRIGDESREAAAPRIGWSGGALKPTASALLIGIVLAAMVMRVAWIGLIIAWTAEAPVLALPSPLPGVALPEIILPAMILLSAGAVLGLLLVWAAFAFRALPSGARAGLPWGRRRILAAGISVGALVLAVASHTKAMHGNLTHGINAGVRRRTCRYIRRERLALSMGDPRMAPGLYVTPPHREGGPPLLRVVNANGRLVGAGSARRLPVHEACRPATEGETALLRRRRGEAPRPVVLFATSRQDRTTPVASRKLRETLRPVSTPEDLAGPLRLGRRAGEVLEAAAIDLALRGDPGGAVGLLTRLLYGEELRRVAAGNRPNWSELDPEDLASRFRMLDLAAKIARDWRLEAELRDLPVVAQGMARVLEDHGRRKAWNGRYATGRLRDTPEDRVVRRMAETFAGLGGPAFERLAGRLLKRARRKPKVRDGLTVREARLVDTLRRRAETWNWTRERQEREFGPFPQPADFRWNGQTWRPGVPPTWREPETMGQRPNPRGSSEIGAKRGEDAGGHAPAAARVAP